MRNQKGFTLVELLIVVIILGVLAAVVIPQLANSTEDAKLATMKMNLAEMRKGIELYYHQHGGTYPGFKNKSGLPATTIIEAKDGFFGQMTRFTSYAGGVSSTKTATFRYGPYIKGGDLPDNPFSGLPKTFYGNFLLDCEIKVDDITAATSDGNSHWKFYTITGRFIANDGNHDDH